MKKKKSGRRIHVKAERTYVPTEIQQIVNSGDASFLHENENILQFIRHYIHGEFPVDFMKTYEGQEIHWTYVDRKKQNNGPDVITRAPLTDEFFKKLTANQENTLEGLEIRKDHMPIFILSLEEEK